MLTIILSDCWTPSTAAFLIFISISHALKTLDAKSIQYNRLNNMLSKILLTPDPTCSKIEQDVPPHPTLLQKVPFDM